MALLPGRLVFLCKDPASRLVNCLKHGASVMRPELWEAVRALGDKPRSPAQTLFSMENVLNQRWSELIAGATFSQVLQMMNALTDGLLRMPVYQAANELGMSQRGLHRWVLRYFGLPPKRLQRLLRFQQAGECLLSPDNVEEPLSSLARRVGYVDASHMTKEFRALVGHPPQWVRSADPGLLGTGPSGSLEGMATRFPREQSTT